MAFRRILNVLVLLGCSLLANAQKNNLIVWAGIGNSFTGLKSKEFSNNPESLSDIVSSNNRINAAYAIGFNYNVNINKMFTVQLGAQYNRRNIFTERKIIFGGDVTEYDVYSLNHRLNYINIPAVFCVNVFNKGKHKVMIGGGMVYGFMINGKSDYIGEEFSGGERRTTMSFENYDVKKALVQGENTSQETFNVFDAGVRAQVMYTFNQKWYAQLNYDYSLYDVYLIKIPRWNPVKTRQLMLGVGYQLF